MAKNTKSKNGVKNDNYSSAYEMDRTGNTYEEKTKAKTATSRMEIPETATKTRQKTPGRQTGNTKG